MAVEMTREVSRSAPLPESSNAENEGGRENVAFLEPGGSGISFSLLNEIRSPKQADCEKDVWRKPTGQKSMHDRMKNFRSIDFDPLENEIEESLKRSRSPRISRRIVRLKWGISIMIGIVTGTTAFLTNWAIFGLQSLRYKTAAKLVEDEKFADGFFVFVLLAVLFSGSAALLVAYIEPLAAGSGIPELKMYLNGIYLKGILRFKTLVAKLVGIVFSISGSLIAGKEGPFVHGGGIIGSALAQMASTTFGWKSKELSYFRNELDHRDFTAIGTATGVATAFGAPIGGILFAVEEGTSYYSTNLVWRGFLSTCIGVLTLHYLDALRDEPAEFLSGRLGTFRDFGLFKDDEAKYSQAFWWYAWEVPIFALIGVIGGLLGAAFVWINLKISTWRIRWMSSLNPAAVKILRILEVIGIAFLTSVIAFSFSVSSYCKTRPEEIINNLENGGDSVDDEKLDRAAKDYYRELNCEGNDEYSVFGQLFFVPLSDALKFLLHLGEALDDSIGDTTSDRNDYQFEIAALFSFFIYVYFFMTITYGVGAPQGLFVPSLASGAAVGRLVGRLVEVLGFAVDTDLETYAVIGAAAMLGGVTRMTISITVLVMETTGSLQLIVPLMITIVCAKHVGDSFSLGIYDAHIQLRGAPLLEEWDMVEESHTETLHSLKAKNVMTGVDRLIFLRPVMRVKEILAVMSSHDFSTFPVAREAELSSDEQNSPSTSPPHSMLCNTNGGSKDFQSHAAREIIGFISRDQLLRLLEQRVGIIDVSSPKITLPKSRSRLRDIQFQLEEIPNRPQAKNILQDQELLGMNDKLLDLRPFLDQQPFTVDANASTSRAYRLLRTMGVRNIYVIQKKPAIIGVLTRKDLNVDHLESAHHEFEKSAFHLE